MENTKEATTIVLSTHASRNYQRIAFFQKACCNIVASFSGSLFDKVKPHVPSSSWQVDIFLFLINVQDCPSIVYSPHKMLSPSFAAVTRNFRISKWHLDNYSGSPSLQTPPSQPSQFIFFGLSPQPGALIWPSKIENCKSAIKWLSTFLNSIVSGTYGDALCMQYILWYWIWKMRVSFVYMYFNVSNCARMIVLIDMTAFSSVRVTHSARGIQEIMSCFEVGWPTSFLGSRLDQKVTPLLDGPLTQSNDHMAALSWCVHKMCLISSCILYFPRNIMGKR